MYILVYRDYRATPFPVLTARGKLMHTIGQIGWSGGA